MAVRDPIAARLRKIESRQTALEGHYDGLGGRQDALAREVAGFISNNRTELAEVHHLMEGLQDTIRVSVNTSIAAAMSPVTVKVADLEKARELAEAKKQGFLEAVQQNKEANQEKADATSWWRPWALSYGPVILIIVAGVIGSWFNLIYLPHPRVDTTTSTYTTESAHHH